MNFFRICRVIFFVTLILSSCYVYPDDEETKQQFRKLNELNMFEVSFIQVKTLKDLNFTIKSVGSLKVSKPSNIVWKVVQPSYLEVNISSNRVTILSKEMDGSSQKQTYEYEKRPKNAQSYSSLLNLMSLLTMDIEQLMKEYVITKKGKEAFLFTPKIKSDIFKNILIQLRDDHLIKSVELLETSGDTMHISFKGYKINK